MTIFRDEAHLYRVLDAFFTRVRDTPALAEAMGRFSWESQIEAYDAELDRLAAAR